jgi:phenylalanyl-tRNA synthetase beta chain
MKVSHEWLGQFISPLPSPQSLGEALTLGGLPVEVIEPVGQDTMLDVEVTSNRSDCLSHQGVARELAALLDLTFKPVACPTPGSNAPAPLTVAIEDTSLCPHYTARLIRGVKVGPSPAWMVRRLETLGLRSINNIVDITNYVMMELGHPLHAFDFAKLAGGKIIVRTARPGETLVTLDGTERKLEPWMLGICDADKPAALAGVMGGELSGVVGTTTDILLESARFDPMLIRKTARQLAMASDSSYRFERGLDPTLTRLASDRAASLIVELAGGGVVGPIVEAGAENHTPASVTMRVARLQKLLGVDWSIDRCVGALSRLGFAPKVSGESIVVAVPSSRLDVRIEADVIEETARVIGYDQIPLRDEVSIKLQPRDQRKASVDLARRTLNAAGFFEALTFSFIADNLVDLFTHDEAIGLHTIDPRTRKADNRLRPSVLPGLIESIRRNQDNGVAGARLFEIASAFWIGAGGASVERRVVALAGECDYATLAGAATRLLQTLEGSRAVTIEPATRAGFGSGACGRVLWGSEPVGYVGLCDRAVVDRTGLRDRVAMAELSLDVLVRTTQHVPQLKPLPRFPAVRRDLSLVLPEQAAFASIESVVRQLKLEALESVEHVTTYRGKPLDKGTKSVTIQLVFRKPDATLTSSDVDGQMARVIEGATKQLGATLRA